MDDDALAADVARRAGALLLRLRDDLGFEDVDALRAAGDARSNDMIVSTLRAARPRDAILSEESADDTARLEHSRVWIVDPLDGTREFAEVARADWAVHVALVEHGCPTVGGVALPALDLVLRSRPRPALRARRPGPVRLAVSRTRPPAVAAHLGASLGAELVAMGSAGAKVMAVVRGEVDVYAHAGGQYEWDSAAPVAVARAAGLHASRLDGSPLRYNQASPWLPDLLVCRPELADHVLSAVASAERLTAP